MEVVVVQGDRLDHPGRPGEPGARAHVDLHRAGADEAVHQVLGQGQVDLVHRQRRPLGPASKRVVDVHVEAALVGGVPDRPELGAEVAAVRPAQIADAHPRGARMGGRVGVDHAQRGAHEVVGSPAPPGSVGRAPVDRVPGEEMGALGGQPHSPQQAAGVWEPDRLRAAPANRAPGTELVRSGDLAAWRPPPGLAISPGWPWRSAPLRPPSSERPRPPGRAAGRARGPPSRPGRARRWRGQGMSGGGARRPH